MCLADQVEYSAVRPKAAIRLRLKIRRVVRNEHLTLGVIEADNDA